MSIFKPFLCGLLLSAGIAISMGRADEALELSLRYQEPLSEDSGQFLRLSRKESWNPAETAVIICDMWDAHHCVNAVRRVIELAPQIDAFAGELRGRGATIIHAPSSCMEAYTDNPARKRAEAVPMSKSMPEDIASWCDQIPSEEAAAYPLDQSAGGEDDDPLDHQQWAERLAALGLNPRAPWKKQIAAIHIDETRDFISDSGTEIWSILERQGITNVILVGVHTNMCVLGRPFGLRRLASGGKNVVLARDLTDTMYNPAAWPYVSHFTGTDLIVSHVERYVCPTIASNQVLGGAEFRFSGDDRIRLAMLIAEDEYETERTLPAFAQRQLGNHYSVSIAHGSPTERFQIIGIEDLVSADALLVSVRRRALPTEDLQLVRDFIARAKPVIGIRTASHAFSLRNETPPEGCAVWPEFDAEVFGGNYTNHYGNDLASQLLMRAEATPIDLIRIGQIDPAGSLYKTAPLAAGALVLLNGQVEGEPEQPVAWTFIRSNGGRSFYTSLGHPGDFEQPGFQALLLSGIHWACQVDAPSGQGFVKKRNKKYDSSSGKQR